MASGLERARGLGRSARAQACQASTAASSRHLCACGVGSGREGAEGRRQADPSRVTSWRQPSACDSMACTSIYGPHPHRTPQNSHTDTGTGTGTDADADADADADGGSMD